MLQRLRTSNVQIAVGTEGNFGTLPDGLSIYFFKSQESSRIRIDGIGQPVWEIPEWMKAEQREGKEVYLVVNSSRNFLNVGDEVKLLQEYSRPNKGPSLMLLQLRGSN